MKVILAKVDDVKILVTVMFADVLMELLEVNVKVNMEFYQLIFNLMCFDSMQYYRSRVTKSC